MVSQPSDLLKRGMSTLALKKLMLIIVKYAPAIMGLSCVIKVYLVSVTETSFDYLNIVNVILDSLQVIGYIIAGKALGFCSSHSNIGYLTLFGYGYYTCYMLDLFPLTEEAAALYGILLLYMTIIYRVQSKSRLNNHLNNLHEHHQT